MARERSNFENYSMCYKHVWEHARQKLCQKEQELDVIRRDQSPPEDKAGQIAELSHNMIMEVTALRARLMDLEEETLNLKKQIRKEVQEEYEALVQALFVTCLHITVSDLGRMSGQSCGDPVYLTPAAAVQRDQ
ncbi:hypothetical protein J1605_022432 [Eschrichtius robustus]|uniref:Uncharacterized protein n=1 Tax=Eschrichtius robustus TaxID=9764 RepID=A0AB34H7I1_ESCRO|nr:hypothetical protein J1605_022432 [Eschrichtius robustus]